MTQLQQTARPPARTDHASSGRAWPRRGSVVRLFALPLLLGGLVACGGDDGSTDPANEPDVPSVTGVSPAQGTSGTEVRVDGGNLSSNSEVFFDDLPSPRVELEAGSLFALAPAGLQAGATYDVRVVNTLGSVSAADTAAAVFEAIAPADLRVNGVTKPQGLEGMTVIIEGKAFGDSLDLSEGAVFFEGSDGAPLGAAIEDPENDWTDGFIVTSVPQAIADTSKIWVETALGASDSVDFRILQSGQFSPSNIEWTPTTSLPAPLQGLGAAFVPVEGGPSPANYIFVYGGADADNTARTAVYRNTVLQDGSLDGAWSEMVALPEGRAYQATAAATAFTAALDTTETVGVLYALGGVNADGSNVGTVQLARISPDGSLGAWMTTTPLPEELHSADAVLFRGYMYVAGGAGNDDAARSKVYRAKVGTDGALEDWTEMDDLPVSVAHRAFVNFGPFLYWVGGETGQSAPVSSTRTGTETAEVFLARLNLRTADIGAEGWTTTESMAKSRSKHSTVFAGGALFTTSGIFAGEPGSSENTFANLRSDGTLEPWQGATGAETIAAELTISLYNQALVTFIDQDGTGHLLVLGGADIGSEGTPSDFVVWY